MFGINKKIRKYQRSKEYNKYVEQQTQEHNKKYSVQEAQRENYLNGILSQKRYITYIYQNVLKDFIEYWIPNLALDEKVIHDKNKQHNWLLLDKYEPLEKNLSKRQYSICSLIKATLYTDIEVVPRTYLEWQEFIIKSSKVVIMEKESYYREIELAAVRALRLKYSGYYDKVFQEGAEEVKQEYAKKLETFQKKVTAEFEEEKEKIENYFQRQFKRQKKQFEENKKRLEYNFEKQKEEIKEKADKKAKKIGYKLGEKNARERAEKIIFMEQENIIYQLAERLTKIERSNKKIINKIAYEKAKKDSKSVIDAEVKIQSEKRAKEIVLEQEQKLINQLAKETVRQNSKALINEIAEEKAKRYYQQTKDFVIQNNDEIIEIEVQRRAEKRAKEMANELLKKLGFDGFSFDI